jgi:hypothetical protein
MALKIKNSNLTRQQARRAYSSNCLAAVLYSLTSVDLTQKQHDTLQRIIITPFIQKCGYERCFPRDVVYGPMKLGGLNMHHIHVETNCRKIETLITHINADTELGRLFIRTLNWYQKTLGLMKGLFEGAQLEKYMEQDWFTELAKILEQIQCVIKIKKLWKPSLLRANYRTIMDELAKHDISPSEKKIFNNWRLYFRVTTLAQVCNNAGEFVKMEYLNYYSAISQPRIRHEKWPNQKHPAITKFGIWRRIILQIANCNGLGKLRRPMGEWYKYELYKHNHQQVLHYTKQHIAIKNDNTEQWKIFNIRRSTRTKMEFTKRESMYTSNLDLNQYIPVDIENETDAYTTRIRNFYETLISNTNKEKTTTQWI